MICLEAQTQPGVFLPIENTPVLVTLLTDKSQQAQSPATGNGHTLPIVYLIPGWCKVYNIIIARNHR